MAEMKWNQLLDAVASKKDLLGDEFVREFRARGMYSTKVISDNDLKTTAIEVFSTIISRLRSGDEGVQDGSELQAAPGIDLERYASVRVEQGVDLQEAVLAVRLDFVVLWRALNQNAKGEVRDLLMEKAEVVYTVVDDFSHDVKNAFEKEIARRKKLKAASVQDFLGRLLAAPTVGATQLREVAEGLGVDVAGRFALVVVPTRFARALDAVVKEQESELKSFSTYAHGAFCVFWQVGGSAPSLGRLRELLSERKLRAWGVMDSNVQGLERLRTSCMAYSRLVQGAALRAEPRESLFNAGQIVSSVDVLSSLWVDIAEKAAPGVVADRVAVLADIDSKDLENMVETVEAFFELGSIKAVASRTYCHRNTVVNRLKAFESHTGLSPMLPRDCILIALVVEQLREQGLVTRASVDIASQSSL